MLFLTAFFWAKARDPYHREWWSLQSSAAEKCSAAVVMPKGAGPFPVVVWCHGSGGSLDGDGETLREFASLGMAAVGIEYNQTNQAGFDAQFAAVLDEIEKQPWAAKGKQLVNRQRETQNAKPGTSPLPSTINYELSTKLAWVGHSLGAQRQLSFLQRHSEYQPTVLVRLNGGMVEEIRANAEHGVSTAKHTKEMKGATEAEQGDTQPSTFNPQLSTPLAVWIAHGENDEVFPVSDVRAVGEWLRDRGAEVEFDVFAGYGHGFGEDQPLLVRRAVEFCADHLGASQVVPDNVRASRWYYWIPVGVLGLAFGAWSLGRRTCGVGETRQPLTPSLSPSDGERVPSGRVRGLRSSRWFRLTAGLALVAAVLLTGAHLLLPYCQTSPRVNALAGQWCVRPELRSDFDWLTSQPGVSGARLHPLLDHLNLAELQRDRFSDGLSEAEWREFVLSPVITGSATDIAWRRDLWEFLAPRVRREDTSESAAQIVVRELRRRVLVKDGNVDSTIAEAWASGRVNERGRELLLCAMLRSVGVPARIADDGQCQFWAGAGWQAAPEPLIR